jgi:uncharacterized protein YbjT (DUF2867 family)
VIYAPTGDGQQALVDPRDVAAVAVAALTGSGHGGRAYELTGPDALSVAEQAALIGEAIGRPVRHVDVLPGVARAALIEQGVPAAYADALGELLALVRTGDAAAVTHAVREVTGRPPRTFAAWVREHAADFR